MPSNRHAYSDTFDSKLSLHDPRVIVMGATLAVALCLVAADAVVQLSKHSAVARNSGHSAIVQLTAAGFIPATIAVKAGTQIIWKNTDAAPHEVAADPYPTDASVPGLHSRPILPGDTYVYTASTLGTIHYHDQSSPSVNGTIVVGN